MIKDGVSPDQIAGRYASAAEYQKALGIISERDPVYWDRRCPPWSSSPSSSPSSSRGTRGVGRDCRGSEVLRQKQTQKETIAVGRKLWIIFWWRRGAGDYYLEVVASRNLPKR